MRFPQDVPTLTDGVVTLRAHHDDDAPGVLEQCLDPVSRRWTTVPLEYTLPDARRFVRDVVPGGWRSEAEWSFALEADHADGTRRFGGTVSLRDEGEGRAEIAYGAHPGVRGTGAVERALRLLLTWGFAERGLRTVVWWAHQGNWASRRAAWRLGFSFDGTVRHWLAQRGELHDGWVGTLLAGEPLAPRAPWLGVPRIVGDRVVLRRHRDTDVDRVVEACRDGETARWLGQIPQPFTRDHAVEFLGSREDEQATGQSVTWAMADPADDRLVGLVNLFGIVPERHAEVGYWVHPEARGRGVATEATRLVLRHAFVPVEDGGLGLVRVYALAAEGNLASRRVLEGAGMTYQGRQRRRLTLQGGVLADAASYDVLAEELRALG